MFEQFSYKQKFTALLVLFVMLSITAYKRSFRTLLEVRNENKVLRKNIEELQHKSKNTNNLLKEVAVLDQLIGKEGITAPEVQQQIVNFASIHPKISISDLQPIHIVNDGNYDITSNQIDVTGNANQLLQLGYAFEKNFNSSRLTSMCFYTSKKNNPTEILHLKMLFQNYKMK